MRETSKGLIVVAFLVAACGGGAKETRQTSSTSTAAKGAPDEASPEQGIPPEKLEEVQAIFRRKAMQATSCYNQALDGLEAAKQRGHQGNVTISLTLGTNGKATNAKVEKSTLDLPKLDACLIEQVMGWSFPELPQKSFFNWTFTFKPAY